MRHSAPRTSPSILLQAIDSLQKQIEELKGRAVAIDPMLLRDANAVQARLEMVEEMPWQVSSR